MKAQIQNLEGKYYGTHIIIMTDDGEVGELMIKELGTEPSERQLNAWGYTQKDWDNNIPIQFWDDSIPIREAGILEGNFENTASYNLACEIVARLNDE